MLKDEDLLWTRLLNASYCYSTNLFRGQDY